MFLSFNEEAQKMLLLSLKEKNKLNDTHIGSEHILLALLTMKNNNVCRIFNEYDVYYNNLFSILKKKDINVNDQYYIFTPLINNIFIKLSNTKKDEVTVNDIIIEILSNSNSKVIYLLRSLGVDISGLIKKLNVKYKTKKKNNKSILKELAVNLSDNNNDSDIIEREEEINEILEILCCKNKNNPILIGEAGVGKTAIVEELAKRISDGLVPSHLFNKKIYSISMSSLVAGTKYRGEFEEKINKLIEEVENDEDIILFIDEIHTLVGAGGADGAIDASNILKPALARGKIKLIGATTKDEYDKYILSDKALNRRFKMVVIEEPSVLKVKKILMGIKKNYENYHNVYVDDSLIDKIIYFCDRYITEKKYPDKAIDILDEICVSALFDCKNNMVNNLDKEKQKIIDLKNDSLILKDYKSAIKYSQDEKKIDNKISKFNKNGLKRHKKILVDEKYLLKVMERKINLPFYSMKFKPNFLKDRFNEFKNSTYFSKNIYDNIFDITNNLYFNLTNNCLYNEINFYSDIDHNYISTYINCFFPNINVVNLDINNYRFIDDLLNEQFLNQLNKYNFLILNIVNYDTCDKSIKEFFNMIKKDGFYIDKNNKKYIFNRGLFIYNNKILNKSFGFNKEDKINKDNSVIIYNYSNKKIKDRIIDICKSKDIHFDNKFISKVIDNVIEDKSIDNIDYYINRIVKENTLKYNKNRTINI